MDNKHYSFTSTEIDALIMFLDRVEYKGFKEINMISRIIEIIKNPIEPPKIE